MRPEHFSPAKLDDRIVEYRDRYLKTKAEADRLLVMYGEAGGLISEGQAEHLNRTIVARDRAAGRLKRFTEQRAATAGSVKAPERGPTLVRSRDPYDLSSLRAADAPYNSNRSTELAARVGPYYETATLQARAHDAVEQAPEYVTWEHRESAARLIDHERWGGDFALYMLTHGSPRYSAAFFEYMRAGNGMSDETRSILGTTGAAGGYLASVWTDPTVILTNNGTVNAMRSLATVKTIPTGQTWNGVSSSAMTAEWATTAVQFADGGPSSFAQPSITPQRADVHVVSSIELARDSDVGDQVMRLFADARDVLEGTAFITGTGVQQPQGIVSKLAGITASRVAAQTNGSLGPVDAFAALNALPARFVNNASFLSHWYVQSILRQQAQAQPSLIVDIGPRNTLMLAMPYYLSSAMLNAGGSTGLSTATASSDNVLVVADFASAYTIVDVVGLEVVVDDIVVGSNGRPTGQVSWSGFWRSGGDVTNTNAAVLVQT